MAKTEPINKVGETCHAGRCGAFANNTRGKCWKLTRTIVKRGSKTVFRCHLHWGKP